MDATVHFPCASLNGNQYILVVYNYTSNTILAEAIPKLEAATICATYKQIFNSLKKKGFKPCFNVFNNQESASIKKVLDEEDSNEQFVEPFNHRVNAAEKEIHIFKDHFIAGLCTTYPGFTTQLGDYMMPQEKDTLNLIQTSKSNPDISNYEELKGKFYFDRWIIEPAETSVVVYDSSEDSASWASRGTDACYLLSANG